jgi:hypothetical protein
MDLLIKFIHILLILYVMFGSFVLNGPESKMLYFWVTTGLIVHWFTGSRVCCLTMAENILTGKQNTDSFLYRTIDPVYNLKDTIPDGDFREFVKWATIILWAQNLLREGPILPSLKDIGLFNKR